MLRKLICRLFRRKQPVVRARTLYISPQLQKSMPLDVERFPCGIRVFDFTDPDAWFIREDNA